MDFLTTIVALIVIVALGLLAAWLLRGYLSGGSGSAGLFGGGRDRRIGVIDSASVDGRRKLLLIQRDGVEHLIMTGGPVDVVIETGISPQRRPAYEHYPQSRQQQPQVQPQHEVGDGAKQQPSFGRVRQPAAAHGGGQ